MLIYIYVYIYIYIRISCTFTTNVIGAHMKVLQKGIK